MLSEDPRVRHAGAAGLHLERDAAVERFRADHLPQAETWRLAAQEHLAQVLLGRLTDLRRLAAGERLTQTKELLGLAYDYQAWELTSFDLLSERPGEERGIEVKGRVGTDAIELTANEWARACNLRGRYWLYAVFDCGSARPRLYRVQDPFGQLLARGQGGVLINDGDIVRCADSA